MEVLRNVGGAVVALALGLAGGQPAMRYARTYAGLPPVPPATNARHRMAPVEVANAQVQTAPVAAVVVTPTPKPALPVVVLATPTTTGVARPGPLATPTPAVSSAPSALDAFLSGRQPTQPHDEVKTKKELDDAVSKARKKAEQIKKSGQQ